MADGLNKVILIGNLGADPELRMTNGGSAVMTLRLATTRSYLDKNKVRQENTEWHQVAIWGKRAEGLAKILKKGSRLGIEGEIRYSEYDDKDGVKRYRTTIHTIGVTLCDRAPSSARDHFEADDELPPPGRGGDDDDIPF